MYTLTNDPSLSNAYFDIVWNWMVSSFVASLGKKTDQSPTQHQGKHQEQRGNSTMGGHTRKNPASRLKTLGKPAAHGENACKAQVRMIEQLHGTGKGHELTTLCGSALELP